jgi:hypothetical protein
MISRVGHRPPIRAQGSDGDTGRPCRAEGISQPYANGEHFYVCKACGQAVEMRNLGEVFRHEEPGHQAKQPS